MADFNSSIREIEAAAERLGLAEFARQAEVPYTTVVDLHAKGWRPKSIRIFEKLLAATAVPSNARPSDTCGGMAG